MANPQIVVEYIAKTEQLQRGMTDVQRKSDTTKGRLRSLGRTAVVAAGAAGLGALVATFKIGIDEFSEAAKVGAQTEAVIKSTGGAAKVTSKHVEDLAGALSAKTGMDDEAIQSGENLLLTFTDIRNETGKGNKIFDRATKTMLDMSAALGQDTKQSAIQLGKALQDPIKGVGALRRVGVNFTDAQKEQIEALVKSGDKMGAQKKILEELNKEFGGSAEAAGKTVPGQMKILRNSFDELAGEIVKVFVPAFSAVTSFFVEHPTLAKAVVLAILGIAAALVIMNVALAITAVVASPVALVIIAIAAAVAALIVVAILLYKNWDKITEAFDKGMATVKGIVQDVLGWLRRNWPLVVGILLGPFALAVVLIIRHWDQVRELLTDFISWVRGLAERMTTAATGLGGAIIAGVVQGLVGIGSKAWNVINNIGEWIADKTKTITQWGIDIASAIWTGFTGAISGLGTKLYDEIRSGINAIINAWNKLKIPGFKIKGPGPLPDINFPAINFPNLPLIPKLAKGGIVTGPTLAMLGERGPEAVIPLAGGAPSFDVRVFIGDTELKGLVRSEIHSADNRTAQVLFSRRM
jgi:hypothetical protein